MKRQIKNENFINMLESIPKSLDRKKPDGIVLKRNLSDISV